MPEECAATSASTSVTVEENACPEITGIEQQVLRQTAVEIEYEFKVVLKEEDEPASAYAWTFGDGGTGTGAIVTHVYARTDDNQTYEVAVVGTVDEACNATSATTTAEVTEKTCPEIIRIDSTLVSESATEVTYAFTAVLKEEDEAPQTYTWDFGDGGSGEGKTATHTFVKGTDDEEFTVVVNGAVPTECESTSATIVVQLGDKDCAQIEGIEIRTVRENAVEVEYEFTVVLVTPDEPATRYLWTFGDGGTGEGATVTHVFIKQDEAASYDVVVDGEVPAGCEATSSTLTVDVGENMCPVIERIDQRIVRENAIEVEVEYTAVMREEDELATAYSWTFGDGGIRRRAISHVHTYSKPEEATVYDVEVIGQVPEECDSDKCDYNY